MDKNKDIIMFLENVGMGLEFVFGHLIFINFILAVIIIFFSEKRPAVGLDVVVAFVFHTDSWLCILSASWNGYA